MHSEMAAPWLPHAAAAAAASPLFALVCLLSAGGHQPSLARLPLSDTAALFALSPPSAAPSLPLPHLAVQFTPPSLSSSLPLCRSPTPSLMTESVSEAL